MRKSDKFKKIMKANILSEQRHIKQNSLLIENNENVLNKGVMLTEHQKQILIEGEKIEKIKKALKKGVITTATAIAMLTSIQGNAQSQDVKDNAEDAIEMVSQNDNVDDDSITNPYDGDGPSLEDTYKKVPGQNKAAISNVISTDLGLFELEKADEKVAQSAGVENLYVMKDYQSSKLLNFIKQKNNSDLFEITDNSIKIDYEKLVKAIGLSDKFNPTFYKTRVVDMCKYYSLNPSDIFINLPQINENLSKKLVTDLNIDRSNLIESFYKTFNKIKRVNENELGNVIHNDEVYLEDYIKEDGEYYFAFGNVTSQDKHPWTYDGGRYLVKIDDESAWSGSYRAATLEEPEEYAEFEVYFYIHEIYKIDDNQEIIHEVKVSSETLSKIRNTIENHIEEHSEYYLPEGPDMDPPERD